MIIINNGNLFINIIIYINIINNGNLFINIIIYINIKVIYLYN